jgi:hypothetical protein
MRSRGQPLAGWLPVLALCGLAPLVTNTILDGHPEEALGGALCVAGVLLAADGRAMLAGLAVGLAIVNKQWGVLAIAPAVLALPAGGGRWGGRVRLLALAIALPSLQLLTAQLEAGAGQGALVGGAQQAGFAHAFDLWWPLAHANRHLGFGNPPFWITDWTPPAWVASHAHELIVALSLPLAALLVSRRGWRPSVDACLALLALLLLLRCVLDPQDLFYYHLPLVLALIAWEAHARLRAPWISLSTLVFLYVVFNQVGPTNAHTWVDFLTYLAVTVPLGGYLLSRLIRSERHQRAAIARLQPAPAHH